VPCLALTSDAPDQVYVLTTAPDLEHQPLARLIKELRRRANVVGIFPDELWIPV
jgi:hypothetical protein